MAGGGPLDLSGLGVGRAPMPHLDPMPGPLQDNKPKPSATVFNQETGQASHYKGNGKWDPPLPPGYRPNKEIQAGMARVDAQLGQSQGTQQAGGPQRQAPPPFCGKGKGSYVF